MGIIIRQGIKGTLVSYMGTVLGYINMLILFPLFFSTTEIGLYRILLDASSFFVIFSILGAADTSVRFFPFFKDTAKSQGQFLFYILTIASIGFVLFMGVYLFFNDEILKPFIEKSPELVSYKYYLIPLVFLNLFYVVFYTYCRSLLRIVVPKFFKEVIVRLLLGAAAIFFFLNFIDFTDYIGSIVGIYFIVLVLIIGYIAWLNQLKIYPNTSIFKSEKFKEMTVFGFLTLISAGSGVIVARIDTLMLGSMTGLSDTGVYGIAFYIGAIIQLPRRSLSEISAPVIASMIKEKKMDQVHYLYKKTSINLLIIGSLFFILVWSNVDAIFSLIPNSELFVKGKYVVFFIGLAKLFDMSLGLNHEIITNSKYYKWNTILIPLLAITTIVTNLIFIPKYGITGAAIASLISISSINLLRYILILIKFNIQPFNFNTLKGIMIAIISFFCGSFVPDMDYAIIEILIRSMVILFIFAILIFTMRPSEDINSLISGLWTRLNKKHNS